MDALLHSWRRAGAGPPAGATTATTTTTTPTTTKPTTTTTTATATGQQGGQPADREAGEQGGQPADREARAPVACTACRSQRAACYLQPAACYLQPGLGVISATRADGGLIVGDVPHPRALALNVPIPSQSPCA